MGKIFVKELQTSLENNEENRAYLIKKGYINDAENHEKSTKQIRANVVRVGKRRAGK